MRGSSRLPILLFATILACRARPPAPSTPAPDPASATSTDPTDTALPAADTVVATVTLDGAPIANAWVGVGGGMSTLTDQAGQATLDMGDGDWVIASHPDARTAASMPSGDRVTVELTRFSREDNEAYVFEDPGEPGDRGTTAQCAHCHQSAIVDWDASAHRTAASNPVLHDVYAGVASSAADEPSCAALGGRWDTGLEPGTGANVGRCYVGPGTLPDLNDCGTKTPCDGQATVFGGCADCHAPGIDGELGGRDLLEARGRSHDSGVHCDVCHKVEAVDLDEPPGVGGALRILRPSEPGVPGLGAFLPLSFGPYPDVPNLRMGAVPRELFREAEICGGCHQLDQTALVPGTSLDPKRWPDGRLPVHSTYQEWLDGPYSPTAPCQSCHMPPEERYLTAVDWVPGGLDNDPATGWPRPPGAIRRHTFDGPRSVDDALLRLALALDLDVVVRDSGVVVTTYTTNVGAGHAVPTGEPFRSVILTVEATCDGSPLRPQSGDVVPEFGGAQAVQLADADWSRWPDAAVGDRIRVVRRDGFRAYVGPAPFDGDRFSDAEKGMPMENWVDEATVVSVSGDQVVLDHALAAGDVAYRVTGNALAGAPGFGFARVLADIDGNLQVPHHRAVDVVSDNRLVPQAVVQTGHTFEACDNPVVTARLIHRALPFSEAKRRAWPVRDTVMVEVVK